MAGGSWFGSHARRATLRGVACLALLTGTAAADEAIVLEARISCRVQRSFALCTVPVSVQPGARITYAETKLVKVPEFLKPAGGTSYSSAEDTQPALRIGFVVKKPGRGTLVVEARAVACKSSPYCPHLSKTVATEIATPE